MHEPFDPNKNVDHVLLYLVTHLHLRMLQRTYATAQDHHQLS